MRMWIAAAAAVLALASTQARAESWEKLPLIAGDPELFSMVEMTESRCTLQLADLERGYVPEIKLHAIKVQAGSRFVDGVYLTSWTFDRPSSRNTLVSIELFKGDRGRYALAVSPEFTYEGGSTVVNSAQFLAVFKPGSSNVIFKERLNSRAKGRDDQNFIPVTQSVEVKGGTVSFQRTTETRVKLSLSCKL